MYRHCEKALSVDEAILQTIATSVSIKIASFLAMTIFLLESLIDSLSKTFLFHLRRFDRLSVGILWTT